MMWGSYCSLNSFSCCPWSSSLSRLPSPSPSASAHTKHHHKSTRQQQPIVKRGKTRRNREIKSMRAVVQRVASASVEVEGRMVSEIGPGLLVLVGLHDSDVDSDADYICRKVLNMRLFPHDKTGKVWDQNVMQRNLEVLLVSQFTLYGVLKGNKPDFHVAMPPERAKSFYALVVEKFRKSYTPHAIKGEVFKELDLSRFANAFEGSVEKRGKDGVFGAMMKVNLVNDGPVTMQLDSSLPSKNKTGSAEGEVEPK